jgi:hypothetical protein
MEPIIVIQEFFQRFGLTIRIGQQYNRFIIEEHVVLDSMQNSTKIVEFVNPLNHSFHSSQYLKIINNVAFCAIAYCIDVDKYSEWLHKNNSAQSEQQDVSLYFSPQLKGQFTINDLLASSGTFTFSTNYSEFKKNQPGHIFKLLTNHYKFELGYTENSLFLLRNEDFIELSITPVFKPTGNLRCFAIWKPKSLSLLILDETYQEKISEFTNKDLVEEEINNRMLTKNTFTTLPPISLINYVRKMSILPDTICNNTFEFNQLVISMFQTIIDKIDTIGLLYPFWNTIYSGSKIVDRMPKHETEIHPTIYGLLYDQAIAKNVQIIPEYPIAGGNLDFLITGALKNGDVANVCVEFKLAHSKDIENGLIKQLPAYMRAKGCEFGLYCVIFFKGPNFIEPKKYSSITELGIDLNRIRIQENLDNIRIYIIDASQIITPSSLSERPANKCD